MGAAILLFSNYCEPGYAILSVPFGAILLGYWIAHGLRSPKKLEFIRNICLILTGVILMGTAIVTLSIQPVKNLFVSSQEAVPIIAVLAATLVCIWFAKKHHLQAVIISCTVVVFIFTWSTAFIHYPGTASKKISYIGDITTYSPLLVYKDDLVMRGFIDYTGIRPIVISKEIVPIGETAYLAVHTHDLEELLEELNARMETQLITSYKERLTYALIKISPAGYTY